MLTNPIQRTDAAYPGSQRRVVLGQSSRRVLVARTLGAFAARAIRAYASGRIAAVFNRSVYVDLDGCWFCVAEAGAGSGPINVVLEPQRQRRALGRRRVGESSCVVAGALLIGEELSILTGLAESWLPPSPPQWTTNSLTCGLAGLIAASQDRVPDQGLGGLLFERRSDAPLSIEALAASFAVASLGTWLSAHFSDARCAEGVPKPARKLVGLGPGLTPSGDDFLGGVLIALSLLGREDIAATLYETVSPLLPARTGPVSRAHLAAAAAGQGLDALHQAINTVLAGDVDSISSRLIDIDRIGHCSGWDALAGAVTALRASIPNSLGFDDLPRGITRFS